MLEQLLFNVTRYILQLNYLVTVTYYPYNKETIIILHIILLAVTCETTTLSRDMMALLGNVQIMIISKKLVNKLHSVGFVTS